MSLGLKGLDDTWRAVANVPADFCIFNLSQYTMSPTRNSAGILVAYMLTTTMFHDSGSDTITMDLDVKSLIAALFSTASSHLTRRSVICAAKKFSTIG